MKYAEIILSISNRYIDQAFTYIIPDKLEEEATVGMRVVVPFGRGNRRYEGYIVNVKDKLDDKYTDIKLKEVLDVLGEYKVFDKKMLELAYWMSEKYFTPYADCIKCIRPVGVSFKTDYVYEIIDKVENLSDIQIKVYKYLEENGKTDRKTLINKFGKNIENTLNALVRRKIISRDEESEKTDLRQKIRHAKIINEKKADEIIKRDNKQSSVLLLLRQKGEYPVNQITEEIGISESPVKTLEKHGVVSIFNKEIRREIEHNYFEEEKDIILTKEQNYAIDRLSKVLDEDEKKPVVIHGVTGSGKTEVYLKLIEKVLDEGKEAIVLVPEIALTPQTVGRFVKRFGDKVSVTHSRLSQGERLDQWKNAVDGKVSVMIGPRSAIFTPFKNLGIIVIDEEHEHTYKSETAPKYDARDVAIKRGELNNALVIMGSATPSILSYSKTKNNEYELIEMEERISNFPNVEVVDMREELKKGNRSIFSESLYNGMVEALKNNQQIILFLNRRGYSTFVSCRQCGYVVECEDCNINYTYHMYSDKLICHYCGREEENPSNCPRCGSTYIRYFGVGTQRIEDEVKSQFPGVPTLRMDADTTSGKDSHEAILNRFRKGEARILIGTQMIAKGLDFPNVTLVGVVAADVSLHSADYKSGENTFQLLTQVAGRSGRGDIKGDVIIQTYNPEHYAIDFAKDNNYMEYYEHEIALRRQMNYPPFTHIFVILLTGENEKRIIESLYKLKDIILNKDDSRFEIIGPSPAIISKIKKRYRWKLIVKGEGYDELKDFVLDSVEKLRDNTNLTDINVNLTIDPSQSV